MNDPLILRSVGEEVRTASAKPFNLQVRFTIGSAVSVSCPESLSAAPCSGMWQEGASLGVLWVLCLEVQESGI